MALPQRRVLVTSAAGNDPAAAREADFSLVLGGPLFNLFRRSHLSGEALEYTSRRILASSGIAWLPILVLSILAGHALPGSTPIAFFPDIETHVRFLVALPILVGAERFVHQRLLPVVRQFLERRIVVAGELPKFDEAIASTVRLRNSLSAEVILLIVVYTVGIWVWRHQFALSEPSWYSQGTGNPAQLTPAGYWYLLVSLPIFQFVLMRWYYRLFLWFWFLYRVSRLNLRLVPTHPDRTGGIGFLGGSTNAFSPFLVAQGALLAGLIASQIFYAGASLLSFKVQIAGFVAFFTIFMLLPLTVFAPDLAHAKRQGSSRFGKLAERYTTRFEEKWFTNSPARDEELLGSADMQSLADLGNAFGVVREMRLVPFGLKDVARLVTITLMPLVPLTLTAFTLEELTDYLINTVF
jgi:hypothetical protein